MLSGFRKLTKELVRRGVIRTLGAYIAIVWLLAQGLVDLLPAMGFPDWTIRAFLIVAVAGTPVVVFLAWRYDLTRKGLLRDRADVAAALRGGFEQGLGPTRQRPDRPDGRRSYVQVTWVDERGRSQDREFDTAFVIGRDHHVDVRFSDDRVSRQHMQVYPLGNDWYVKDLGSLNGTYHNGEKVDVIRVGKTMEFCLDRTGPKVSLARRVDDDTTLTVESG